MTRVVADDLGRGPLPVATPGMRLLDALALADAAGLPGLPVAAWRGGPITYVVSRPTPPGHWIERSALAPEPAFYRESWADARAPRTYAIDADRLVADSLSDVVIAVPGSTPVARVAALLVRLDVRRVLVLGATPGAPVGRVESLDVLRQIAAGRIR